MLKDFLQSHTGFEGLGELQEQQNKIFAERRRRQELARKENVRWLLRSMLPAQANEKADQANEPHYKVSDMLLVMADATRTIAAFPLWIQPRWNSTHGLTAVDFKPYSFGKNRLNDLTFFVPTKQQDSSDGYWTGIVNIDQTGVMIGHPLAATIAATSKEGHPFLDTAQDVVIPMNQDFGRSFRDPGQVLKPYLAKHLVGHTDPLVSLMTEQLSGKDIPLEALPPYFALNFHREQRNDALMPLRLSIVLLPNTFDNLETEVSILMKVWGELGIADRWGK